MGSNVLKFSMASRDTEEDRYAHPKRDDVHSLVDLARNEPSVKAVLDMPFAWYHIWVYSFATVRRRGWMACRKRNEPRNMTKSMRSPRTS